MSERPVPARSLTASALWLLSAKSIGYGFMFLLPVLLVRQLSQHDFGVYKQIFLVVGTAIALLPLGFGMSAYYFLPRIGEQKGRVVLNILLFHLGVAGATFLVLTLRPDVLAWLFADATLTQYGSMIGLLVLLWIPSSCLETLAVAHGEAPLAGRFIVLLQLSKALLLIGAAVWVGSISALVLAALAHGVVQTATLGAYLYSRFGRFWREFDGSIMRAQLAYAMPHGAAALLYWFQIDLHRYFVAHQFDSATFAIYAIGCFELPMLGILNESVGSVLILRMSQLQKDARRQELIALAAGAIRKLGAVYVPLYVLLLLVGRELITVLFTEAYAAAWPIFLFNMTLIPIAVPTIACDAVIRAYAEHRYFLVKLRVVSTIVLVGCLAAAVARFGLLGAIGVVVGVNLLERMVTTVMAARILRVSRADAPLLADIGKVIVASALAGMAGLLARSALPHAGSLTILVVCTLVVGVTYLALLFAFDVPDDSERAHVRALLARVPFGPSERALAVGVAPLPTVAPHASLGGRDELA